MVIFRVHKNKDFTVMSNYHFKEKNMTLKAKGLLSLMLSLPDDWDFSIKGLCALSKDGKDSVISALEELEKFHYLKREYQRNEKGQILGQNYEVYEQPYSEKPNSEKPYSEKPNSENPPQLNTNINNINVKATCCEKMGFIGKEEGAVAQAVVLLVSKE